jgi:hypothetical protein
MMTHKEKSRSKSVELTSENSTDSSFSRFYNTLYRVIKGASVAVGFLGLVTDRKQFSVRIKNVM